VEGCEFRSLHALARELDFPPHLLWWCGCRDLLSNATIRELAPFRRIFRSLTQGELLVFPELSAYSDAVDGDRPPLEVTCDALQVNYALVLSLLGVHGSTVEWAIEVAQDQALDSPVIGA